MKMIFLLGFVVSFFFTACSSTPIPKAVKIDATASKVDYLKEVKPILEKRCVTCHSCYNSPCQAKMSSFEGVDRGASKLLVYDALRLTAASPTRLFIDAKSTEGWRKKEFYSLTQSPDSNATHNDSIMMHLLYDKKEHPELIGEYAPESDELICPRNKEELGEYFEEKPNHGMPYGFPAIKESEYETLAAWLHQGAKGPTKEEQLKLETPSSQASLEIKKWEDFFNKSDAKHKMTARYLYEHLYLAHIYFPTAKGEYYELVRSYTPSGVQPQIIPTLRPFDDPEVSVFYYRFVKIHSTIVHKTHMVFKFDDRVLTRFHELFIKPKWDKKPYEVGYDAEISSNSFVAFEQIPVRSRYQFLLDNAHYIIQTFIRGPVCRGQMALNVIHDHFWIMFQDPDADMAVLHPELLKEQAYNLALPIKNVDRSVFQVFSDEYRERYEAYYKVKEELITKEFPQGMSLDAIWKGDKPSDAPLLTIYRHFDSASVHKGVIGEEPRTMWVIDYAQLERIYYNLVAGYDVFGNITHQTNIRRYMDFLRIEGELNFLSFMPSEKRFSMLKSWYIGDKELETRKNIRISLLGDTIAYKTENEKNEFINMVVNGHILKSTDIKFDTLNYIAPDEKTPCIPKSYKIDADFIEAARSLTLSGSGFTTFMTDSGANNIFLRIDMSDGTYITKNLVINRWHDNVNSLFNGKGVLDSSKDTMDILNFSVGSYPNAFVVLKEKDLADFIGLMKNMTGTDEEIGRLKKYFVSRSDKQFWEVFDWFQKDYYKKDSLRAGLYDLNRYARTVWNSK